MSFRTAHDGKRSFTPLTDVQLINWARKAEEMDPLPSDDDLNATLQKAGFTECQAKLYSWAVAIVPSAAGGRAA